MFSASAWESRVIISFLIVGAEPTNRHPLDSAAAAHIGIEPGLFYALWKALFNSQDWALAEQSCYPMLGEVSPYVWIYWE